jgi:carbamoyl-phosphate synthase small subunit
MKKAYIALSNGKVFEGYRFGAEKDAVGEIVFTTGMCGYIETMTDPSYYGQIVLQTFPQIGNYGFISEDAESPKCYMKGYIVREWSEYPSNFRSEGDIDSYLKKEGVPGVYGVDTRELTRIIREYGVMNAMITDDLSKVDYEKLNEYRVKDAVKGVSSGKTSVLTPEADILYSVALIDYGAKSNIARELLKIGCKVHIVPSTTTAEEIMELNPDGIMLSNGPGDPAENIECIEVLKKLIGKKPMFGICLGHQLLALAHGGRTEKLKYGHRGANQPVKDLQSGRVFITSQNHGYVVVNDSIADKGGIVRLINANDGTCEGIDYPELKAFSAQFHPEACAGPQDTSFMFDRFVNLMRSEKDAIK